MSDLCHWHGSRRSMHVGQGYGSAPPLLRRRASRAACRAISAASSTGASSRCGSDSATRGASTGSAGPNTKPDPRLGFARAPAHVTLLRPGGGAAPAEAALSLELVRSESDAMGAAGSCGGTAGGGAAVETVRDSARKPPVEPGAMEARCARRGALGARWYGRSGAAASRPGPPGLYTEVRWLRLGAPANAGPLAGCCAPGAKTDARWLRLTVLPRPWGLAGCCAPAAKNDTRLLRLGEPLRVGGPRAKCGAASGAGAVANGSEMNADGGEQPAISGCSHALSSSFSWSGVSWRPVAMRISCMPCEGCGSHHHYQVAVAGLHAPSSSSGWLAIGNGVAVTGISSAMLLAYMHLAWQHPHSLSDRLHCNMPSAFV